MRRLSRIAMICILLVTLASGVFAVPASAEGPAAGNALGAPPIPADVLAITGEAPFIKLLHAETLARGGLAVELLTKLGVERDAIADQLLYYGIETTPRGKYQTMEPPVAPDSADATAIEELDKARFESYMTSLLGTINSPETEAEARALESQIVGEVNNWLSKYRAEVTAKLAANPQPLTMVGTVAGDSGESRSVYVYRNAHLMHVNLTLHDFSADAEKLNGMLQSIGEATTLDEAWQRVNVFYEESTRMQTDAATTATEIQANITTAFTDWAQQFQTQYTVDLEAHGAALGDAATLELLEQAKTEALQAKDDIVARLVPEIQAEMYAKLAEMMAGAGPKAKPTQTQINELMMLGFQIGMSRGGEEGSKAQQIIQSKYMSLSDEARARITTDMEAQAAEAEKWARDELTRLGYLFGGINDRALDAANVNVAEKLYEWQAAAAQQRRDIFAIVLDYRLEDARAVLEASRAEIDEAYAAGRISVNTDDLLAIIDTDREALLSYADIAGDNPEAIAQMEAAYRARWQQIQDTLESARYQTAAEVLQDMNHWTGVSALREVIKNSDSIRGYWEYWGRLHETWADGMSPRASLYYLCLAEKGNQIKPEYDQARGDSIRLADHLELDLTALVNRWEAMEKAPDSFTVEQALALKDDLLVWRETLLTLAAESAITRDRYLALIRAINNNCQQENR
jgi:hypothetical protein